jgi:ABC-2 type transport system ATP-binding protein
MINAHHLTRTFGDFTAVDNLDLLVKPGELYGFLGMNGAGKSTTMRMLVGLLKPTAGHVSIAGYDIQAQPLEAKKRFGYLAQNPFVYERLTGLEFLYFLGSLHRLDDADIRQRTEKWLSLLKLTDKAGQLIGSYSGGMRRKIALAGALLHQPDVLILDEPFAGLDPLSGRHVKDTLQQQAEAGKTILISSHTLEIVERVCSRIGILRRGKLIAEGTLDELRADGSGTLEDIFLELNAEAQADASVVHLVEAL